MIFIPRKPADRGAAGLTHNHPGASADLAFTHSYSAAAQVLSAGISEVLNRQTAAGPAGTQVYAAATYDGTLSITVRNPESRANPALRNPPVASEQLATHLEFLTPGRSGFRARCRRTCGRHRCARARANQPAW
jgi:hypothetical protein